MDDISAKHEELVKKYTRLVTAANNRGLQLSKLRTILSFRNIQKDVTETGVLKKCYLSKRVIFQFIFFVGVINSFSIYYYRFTLKEILEISSTKCLVDNNAFITELARPLTKCGICRNLDSVPIEHDINAVDFRRKYAYSSVPVLIKDATNEWSAMSVFSYQFFKDLYTGTEGALHYVEEECQFFPYNTDFKTLKDVFNMSGERAKFKDGETPWYIGWSNCHNVVKNELRKHYERPYFLPKDSESSSLDWIFMGGSGPGALIHLDYVQRPSWQAQISGTKTWTLIPPPECENECKTLNVTVHKGDIFVIDTNIWYHSTFIHPGDISITIGSEYD